MTIISPKAVALQIAIEMRDCLLTRHQVHHKPAQLLQRANRFATIRTQPSNGSGDRAVGQWFCACVVRAAGQVLIVELGRRWAYLALGGVMAAVVLPLTTLFR